MLKTKKFGVLGANKMGKNLADHELGKDSLKEEVGRNMLSGDEDGILEYGWPIDKIGEMVIYGEVFTVEGVCVRRVL